MFDLVQRVSLHSNNRCRPELPIHSHRAYAPLRTKPNYCTHRQRYGIIKHSTTGPHAKQNLVTISSWDSKHVKIRPTVCDVGTYSLLRNNFDRSCLLYRGSGLPVLGNFHQNESVHDNKRFNGLRRIFPAMPEFTVEF